VATLIETHWIDLMRVVISIREGRISSSALLRRLGNESRKNRIYKAFRELGRAVRTVVLLRYLSEPELRESITTITNRVESFHNFAGWLRFGNVGVLADNDPEHMEKLVKFNELLANCVDRRAQPAPGERPSGDRRSRRRPVPVHDQPHPPVRRLRTRRVPTPGRRANSSRPRRSRRAGRQ
jgi:hypothetical protein